MNLENDSLELSFQDFIEHVREYDSRIQRIRYHRIDSQYLMFQFSFDGIFWTDEFYYSEYISIADVIDKIEYYLIWGKLP